ncbi:hypothetical protein D3C87_1778720 [compost metagenome]
MVPLPFWTVQVWPAGWPVTVTAYGTPATSAVGNENAPLALTSAVSPLGPPSIRLLPTARLDTVPPTV